MFFISAISDNTSGNTLYSAFPRLPAFMITSPLSPAFSMGAAVCSPNLFTDARFNISMKVVVVPDLVVAVRADRLRSTCVLHTFYCTCNTLTYSTPINTIYLYIQCLWSKVRALTRGEISMRRSAVLFNNYVLYLNVNNLLYYVYSTLKVNVCIVIQMKINRLYFFVSLVTSIYLTWLHPDETCEAKALNFSFLWDLRICYTFEVMRWVRKRYFPNNQWKKL